MPAYQLSVFVLNFANNNIVTGLLKNEICNIKKLFIFTIENYKTQQHSQQFELKTRKCNDLYTFKTYISICHIKFKPIVYCVHRFVRKQNDTLSCVHVPMDFLTNFYLFDRSRVDNTWWRAVHMPFNPKSYTVTVQIAEKQRQNYHVVEVFPRVFHTRIQDWKYVAESLNTEPFLENHEHAYIKLRERLHSGESTTFYKLSVRRFSFCSGAVNWYFLPYCRWLLLYRCI